VAATIAVFSNGWFMFFWGHFEDWLRAGADSQSVCFFQFGVVHLWRLCKNSGLGSVNILLLQQRIFRGRLQSRSSGMADVGFS
jgi:hypothetical protein